jgi:CRISPR/Cas system type I-B associated protein Csh2 (Cas7 group RAMP superfamily)
MSDHFVSLNRGQDGFTYAQFVTGTASTPSASVELRVADAAGLTKKDVHTILQAFTRFFENAQQVGAAGFSVSG